MIGVGSRLHSKHPLLADRILSSSEAAKRAVSAAVCLALEHAALDAALGHAILVAVDGGPELDAELVTKIRALQEARDDSYLDASSKSIATDAPNSDALRAFPQSRALAALVLAVEGQSASQAAEVVYEALASCEDEARAVARLEAASGAPAGA